MHNGVMAQIKKMHTTVYIPETLHRKFKSYAAKHGQTFTEAIQAAMIKYMKRENHEPTSDQV